MSEKAKILVVDDEPDALEVLAFNLRRAGFVVLTAPDGACALALAQRERPALIVLDWMLPEVDGLEVCRILRRDPETAMIRILMLTARVGPLEQQASLKFGADAYMTKPFSPRELTQQIHRMLG